MVHRERLNGETICNEEKLKETVEERKRHKSNIAL
jgi:hypothetical protein